MKAILQYSSENAKYEVFSLYGRFPNEHEYEYLMSVPLLTMF